MQFSDEKKEFIQKIYREFGRKTDLGSSLIGNGYAGSIWKISDRLCLKVGTQACSTIIPESFKNCENLCVPLKTYMSPSGRYIGTVQKYLNLHSVQYLIKEERKLSEEQAACIVYDLLKGLKVIHENGYVHRDLYPGNVMLTSEEGKITAAIIDFDEMQPMGTGTKACFRYNGYQAPEIVFDDDIYDDKSEMFAVGVILWELVLGKCSFGGYDFFGRVIEKSWDEYAKNYESYNDRVKAALKTLDSCLKNTEKLSDECADLLCSLLSFNKSNRMTAGEALGHMFFKRG